MTRFPLLDECCSECGHRIGVHYAASNAGEAFGTWCSESGCVCGTDPDVTGPRNMTAGVTDGPEPVRGM